MRPLPALVLTSVLALGSFAGTGDALELPGVHREVDASSAGESPTCPEPRGPIHILSNAEFNASNGVRGGNGTPEKPYIIDCWSVNWTVGPAILVENTTSYFVLRDVETIGPAPGRCVHLNRTANAKVERLRAGPCGEVVVVESSSRIVLESSTIVGSLNVTQIGLTVSDSSWVLISNSTIVDSTLSGVLLSNNTNTELSDNLIRGNSAIGVSAGPGDLVHHNTFIDNGNGTGPQATGGRNESWDNGIEGNWWSDLVGPDDDRDGIVDISYAIAGGASDRFPLCPTGGCWSQSLPRASISADRTSGVAPLEVAFTSNVSGGQAPYAFSWDFGDGNASSDPATSHLFSSPGTYTVVLAVRDSAGHDVLSAPVLIAAAETSSPMLVSMDPPDGTPDVDTQTEITLKFSVRMDMRSTENAVAIAPQHPISFAWSPDATTLMIVPTGGLSLATNYTLTVSTQARSAGGLALEAVFSGDFTTSASSPAFRPEIGETVPPDGRVEVPTNSFVSISFNIEMDPGATAAAVSSEPPIQASYSWDWRQRTLRFDPTVPLEPDTDYRITVGRGIRSADGTRPAREQSFGFRTSTGPDLASPFIWHDPPASLDELHETKISFQVFDPSGIAYVVLHYRSTYSEYSEMEIHLRSGDVYEAALPSDVIRAPRLEYFAEAIDGLGNRGFDPGGGPGSPYTVTVIRAEVVDNGLIPARDAAVLLVILVSAVICMLVWDPARRSVAAKKKLHKTLPRKHEGQGTQREVKKGGEARIDRKPGAERDAPRGQSRRSTSKRPASKHRTNPP